MSIVQELFRVMKVGLLVGSALLWAVAAKADAATPIVDGEHVSNVTVHNAELFAEIDPQGEATNYFFEIDTVRSDNFTHRICPFGPCTSYQEGPPLPPGLVEPPVGEISAGGGRQVVGVSMESVGATLQPSTTYFYRVVAHVAASEGGSNDYYSSPTVYGAEQSFITSSEDSPVSPPSGASPEHRGASHQHHRKHRHRHKRHRHRGKKVMLHRHHVAARG